LLPFLDTIEETFFELPEHIVADAGYGSEQNYQEIINRGHKSLITYSTYRKEQKKKYKNNRFHADHWAYSEEADFFTCPNEQKVTFQYESKRKDKTGFERTFRVYESENCTDCPF
jgi:transposase